MPTPDAIVARRPRLAGCAAALALIALLASVGCEKDKPSPPANDTGGSATTQAAAAPGDEGPADGGTVGDGSGGDAFVGPARPTEDFDPTKVDYPRLPDNWFFRDPTKPDEKTRVAKNKELENKFAPPVVVQQWIGDPVDFEEAKRKGRIVLMHFVTMNVPRTIEGVKRTQRFALEYEDYGVDVFIAHAPHDDIESVEGAVRANESDERPPLPIAIVDPATIDAYNVILYPHFDFIDYVGVLRASGVMTTKVKPMLDFLLEERALNYGTKMPPKDEENGG